MAIMTKTARSLSCSAMLCLLTAWFSASTALAENDVPTKFSNTDSIVNTRHNMTQSTESSNNGGTMNPFRNRYGEVCVYCHTPHAANASVAAPLWNRKIVATTYTVYNSATLNQTVSQPGAASLACLSCHDGQQAIDAIINMPGSSQYYSDTPEPTSWAPGIVGLPTSYKSTQHRTLVQCMACHAPDGGPVGLGLGLATDFTAFYIGTDLTNDHPVGVPFPTDNGGDTGWKTPGGTKGAAKFFDDNGNGHLDKTDIRLYGSSNGPSVECASCHDPHGVPSGGAGTTFINTFLRKSNEGSMVCLTCHDK